MSRASNLAGFSTSISPPSNLNVGVITATSLSIGGQIVSSLGVGINTAGGSVGTGATVLDFRGAGISTVTVSSGIATVNITGGGGGGASVSTSDTAPVSPADGDLWYDSVGGRTYVYYDDGDTSQWVDAAPQGGGDAGFSKLEVGNTKAEIIDTGSDGRFVVTTEGSERLRVTAAGLMGLGTTSPQKRFVVSNNGAEGVEISPGDSSNTNVFLNYNRSSSVYITATHLADIHTWGGYGGTGGNEAMRIDSSGRLLLGTATANASGAKLQTSDGLTFPATQVASADANTLDDYEEGTWTPIDSSGAGLTFTSTAGVYTKIGNICYISGTLTFPSTANGSNATIGGLPFNPSSGTQYQNFGPPIRNNKSLSIQIFGINNTTFKILPIGNYTTYTTNAQMTAGTMQFSYTFQTA